MLNPPTQPMLSRLERLESYLSLEPENLSLLVEVIQLQIEMGKVSDARVRLHASLAKHPQEPQLSALDAMCCLAEHNYSKAAEIYDLLLPSAAPAVKPVFLFNQAYALFCLGDYARAAQQLKGLLLDPSRVPVQASAYLCRALHHQGQLDDAIAVMDEAPAEHRTPELLGLGSAVALDLDRPEQAKELALIALASDPHQVEALATIGSLNVLEGDPEKSMRALRAALEQRPNDGRIWMSVAAGYLLHKDVVQATTAFEKAVLFLPDHVGSLLGLAWCQIVSGELASARESVGKAMQINRNFSEAHGALAAIEALSGNRAAAEGAVRTAKLLDAEDLSSHYALAVLAGDAQNRPAIQNLAKRLIKSKLGFDIQGRTPPAPVPTKRDEIPS